MRAERLLPGLALAGLLSLPAYAQGIQHSGQVRWAFDDLTVRNGETRRRTSLWSQSYDLSLAGPLGHPLVGSGSAALGFSKGADVRQAVDTGDPDRKVFNADISASLFNEKIRRYLRFDPRYSRKETTQRWGDPLIPRRLLDRSWGFNSALSLPKLPSVSVSRSYGDQKDTSDIPSLRQERKDANETVTYDRGALRMRLRHDRRDVRDLLQPSADSYADEKAADVEINKNEVDRGGLRSLFARLNLLSNETGSSGSVSRYENGIGNLYLTSMSGTLAGWRSYASFANTTQRNLLTRRGTMANSLSIISERPLTEGRVNSSLTLSHTGGDSPSRAASEALGVERRFFSDSVTSKTDLSGGITRSGSAGNALSDTARQRVSFVPRRGYDVYLEVGTQGATPSEGSAGGYRRHDGGGGGKWLFPYGESNIRLYRSRTRDFDSGLVTESDQATVQVSAQPVERMNATAAYNQLDTRGAQGTRTSNRTVDLRLDYALLFGLVLTAEGRRTQESYWDTIFEGVYTVGRTRLSARLERRNYTSDYSYSYLSLALTRAF